MNYEKEYKKLKAGIKNAYLYAQTNSTKAVLEHILPELRESEDERIRKDLLAWLKDKQANPSIGFSTIKMEQWLAWLEKQRGSQNEVRYWTKKEIESIINDFLIGAEHYGGMIARLRYLKPKSLEKQEEPIDKEKVLIGARKDVALSIMDFLDRNTLGMCLSNMECKDLEDAIINSKWDKVYGYMKKKLERQGQKETTWNKEDEENMNNVIYVFNQLKDNSPYKEDDIAEKTINWLKSLKFRKQWKPSEEQMNALAEALILAKNCGEESAFDLRTLYEQLKKL